MEMQREMRWIFWGCQAKLSVDCGLGVRAGLRILLVFNFPLFPNRHCHFYINELVRLVIQWNKVRNPQNFEFASDFDRHLHRHLSQPANSLGLGLELEY